MGEAVMISGLGPYTREAYFGKEGPSRVMEEIGILEISSTDVKVLANTTSIRLNRDSGCLILQSRFPARWSSMSL